MNSSNRGKVARYNFISMTLETKPEHQTSLDNALDFSSDPDNSWGILIKGHAELNKYVGKGRIYGLG